MDIKSSTFNPAVMQSTAPTKKSTEENTEDTITTTTTTLEDDVVTISSFGAGGHPERPKKP